ncbi:hypothetical protein RND71_023498 [Anisodus tanguticus]|uniref:Uncharacterized protein n=1 Tax=Anisodus tanguticus TaxID=243964 RepID=A0AAE1RVN7_9SOLA|nr:hypothetical protein RND71_023498 [Anisodus tanguticus]
MELQTRSIKVRSIVIRELRDYFSSYDVKTVKHSNGHRGISAMVFEAIVMGTWRLCFSVSIFLKKGRDRDAWERNPVRFNLEGIRKLYGYRAQKRDLDNFNQHSHVRNAAMHMSEDNQQLVWFKNQAAKYQKKTKALEETLSLVNMAFQYFGPGARNKKRAIHDTPNPLGIPFEVKEALRSYDEKAKGKESNDIVSDHPTSPAVKRSGAKALTWTGSMLSSETNKMTHGDVVCDIETLKQEGEPHRIKQINTKRGAWIIQPCREHPTILLDLDNFNQHSHGKSRLRFGMRLYSENVRNAAMHMSEDNQQLVWFKNQAAKYQKKTKALEETLSLVNMAFLYFGPGARNKKSEINSDNNNEEFERGIFRNVLEPSRDYERKDFLKKKAKGKESNDIVSDPPTSPAVKRSGAKALA